MKPLIIHHKACPDGYGAAYWLGLELGDHDKHAAGYDDADLPDVADRDVFIVDFCYRTEFMNAIDASANRVVVLDHHQTALGELEASTLEPFDSIHEAAYSRRSGYVLDQSHSGIALSALYVWSRGDITPPTWFSNIEDRDLWRFESEETPAVFAAVTARPYTVEAWDEMCAMTRAELAAEGRAIELYRQRLIESIVETRHLMTIDDREVWACASPYAVGSDVANALCKLDPERGFAAYWVCNDLRTGSLKVGLRSLPDGDDVAKIAEKFPPGGGHKHAAGFQMFLS